MNPEFMETTSQIVALNVGRQDVLNKFNLQADAEIGYTWPVHHNNIMILYNFIMIRVSCTM